MSWWSALAICVVLTIVLAVVYVAVLWVVHTPELISAYHSILARLHKTPASEDVAMTAQPEKSRTLRKSILRRSPSRIAPHVEYLRPVSNTNHTEPNAL